MAAAIYLGRVRKSKAEIREYIESKYYKLDFTIDGIREGYTFNETCQGSVPQAIEAFLESADFEDAVRIAVSLGGDSDTIAAITGSIAEAFYGEVPHDIRTKAISYLSDELKACCGIFIAGAAAMRTFLPPTRWILTRVWWTPPCCVAAPHICGRCRRRRSCRS